MIAAETVAAIRGIYAAYEQRKSAKSIHELKESARTLADGVAKLTMQVINAILMFKAGSKGNKTESLKADTIYSNEEMDCHTILNRIKSEDPSKEIYVGELRGEKIILKEVSTQEIRYLKKTPTELILLRKEFDTTVRKDFLIDLVKKQGDDFFKNSGFSDTDILKLKNGRLPDGWQVHHKLSLDDGGTNDFENLLLIQNEPYHKVITNHQNRNVKDLSPGQSKKVDWPIPLDQCIQRIIKRSDLICGKTS